MRRLAIQPARELLSVTRSMVDQVVIPGNRVDLRDIRHNGVPNGAHRLLRLPLPRDVDTRDQAARRTDARQARRRAARRAITCTSRSGTASAPSCSAASDDRVHPEPRLAAARPLFPGAARALLERLPDNCVVDGEIVIATDHGLDFDALQLRLHPAARASRSSRRKRRPRSWLSTCLRPAATNLHERRRRRAPRCAGRSCSRKVEAAGVSHADDARSRQLRWTG